MSSFIELTLAIVQRTEHQQQESGLYIPQLSYTRIWVDKDNISYFGDIQKLPNLIQVKLKSGETVNVSETCDQIIEKLTSIKV